MGETPQAFDATTFRKVLGHFPTGVVVVTSRDAAEPVAMVIGSFTSVSLAPPLVAFLPAKSSTSFPAIRESGEFCVNVLADDQEQLVRAVTAKTWKDGGTGGVLLPGPGVPKLNGAVAWIDCAIQDVIDAGDHYIVVGRVRDLAVAHDSLPLLFFQGGYGRFAPLSFVTSEPSPVGQLRLVDIARPWMERVADRTGRECLATALMRDELVIVARAGRPSGGQSPTRVGQPVPFTPPLGAEFVAWDEQGAKAWLGRLRSRPAIPAVDFEAMLTRVRERGWSVGLASPKYREFESALAAIAVDSVDVEHRRAAQQASHELGAEYDPGEFDPSKDYPVRILNVPVFSASGSVVLLLSVYQLPATSTLEDITLYRDVLMDAAREITRELAETGALVS